MGFCQQPDPYKDLLIVTATAESEALAALDKKTGKVVWKKEASGLNSCWGTPVLCKVDDERTDLVIGVPREIWGFDPETGKLRWYCQANNDDSFCSSVIVKGDVVYAIEGRGGGSIAVRAGGKGDVSSTHVVWSGQESNRIGTPLLVDNQIYFFGNRVANSIRTDDGSRVYQERMTGGDQPAAGGPPQGGPGPGAFGQGGPGQGGPGQGGPGQGGPGRGGPGGGRGGRMGGGMGGDYASAVYGDGKIYFPTRSGDIYVVKAGPQFELLGVNRVTPDREDFSATPAIAGNDLYIRSSKAVYCVSAK